MTEIGKKVLEVTREHPDFSIRQISDMIGCSRNGVRHHLSAEYRKDGTQKKTAKHRERRKRIIELAGGKCIVCGYNKCLAALDFHHKVPSEKERSMSYFLHCKEEKALAEMEKCLLLCCRCHRELHDDLQ